MNYRLLGLCCFFCLLGGYNHGQSLYQFKYSFQNDQDSTMYHAFFVHQEDGSAFVRIRFSKSSGGQVSLIECNLRELYKGDSNGNAEQNKVLYAAIDTNLIIGTGKVSFTSPVFVFARQENDENYEPVGVVSDTSDLSPLTRFSTSEWLHKTKLERRLALSFFNKEEPFFTQLFEPSGRGLSQQEKTTTLHFLGIANTNDPIIGEACGKSMRFILQTFLSITKKMGIGMNIDSISGKIYNKRNVQNALNKINPDANDIVVVYFMGHGFRKSTDPRPFPFFDLRWDPNRFDYDKESLNAEDIFDQLWTKKKARFTLLLSDCCNTDPEATNIVASPVPRQRDSELPVSEDNFRTLFLDPARKAVMATSADVHQKATSNNRFGGFFSYYFRAALRSHLGPAKKYVSWDVVIADARQQTINKAEHTYCDTPRIKENICRQYPFYKKVYSN